MLLPKCECSDWNCLKKKSKIRIVGKKGEFDSSVISKERIIKENRQSNDNRDSERKCGLWLGSGISEKQQGIKSNRINQKWPMVIGKSDLDSIAIVWATTLTMMNGDFHIIIHLCSFVIVNLYKSVSQWNNLVYRSASARKENQRMKDTQRERERGEGERESINL